MMTLDQIVGALQPVFQFFSKDTFTHEQWEQYGLALEHVNPGDLDDALADLRRSHGFRNAPLPAEILDRCQVHRQRRIVSAPPVSEPVITVTDGTLHTLTLKGIGSMTVRVLPDDHPALKRYACLTCKDTGWEDLELNDGKQPTYRRCGCVVNNPVLQQQRAQPAARTAERMR